MGVPVITLAGSSHGSRFGNSILQNAGFGELVAGNKEEYVNKAVMLTKDLELLDELHKNLRKSPGGITRASPLSAPAALWAPLLRPASRETVAMHTVPLPSTHDPFLSKAVHTNFSIYHFRCAYV